MSIIEQIKAIKGVTEVTEYRELSSPTGSILVKFNNQKPLFTTEDGVAAYKGDKTFWVILKGSKGLPQFACETEASEGHPELFSEFKVFSTKEKAHDWVSLNSIKYVSREELVKGEIYFVLGYERIIRFKNLCPDDKYRIDLYSQVCTDDDFFLGTTGYTYGNKKIIEATIQQKRKLIKKESQYNFLYELDK